MQLDRSSIGSFTDSRRVVVQGYWASCCVLLLCLTLWLLAPNLRLGHTTVPVPARTAKAPAATVPMLNCWTMWWNANSLKCGLSDYWNAPIFHPERGTLAFSEPQPAMLALAPFVWQTSTTYPAYHVYLCCQLVLNGLTAIYLLRVLKVSRAAALAGGVTILLQPVVWEQLDVIQLVPLWPIMAIWIGLIKVSSIRFVQHSPHALRPRTKLRRATAIVIGLAAAGCALASICVHHLVMLPLVTAPAMLWLLRRRNRLGPVLCMLAASLVASIGLIPLWLPMLRIHAEYGFARSTETQQALSLQPGKWLTTPDRTWWNHVRTVEPLETQSFNPGWLRLALVCSLPLYLQLLPRRKRRCALFLATVALVSILLSLGPNLKLGGLDGWQFLCSTIPLLDSVRSVYRFAFFAQLALLLLAIVGADQGLRVIKRRFARLDRPALLRSSFVRTFSSLALWLPLIAVALESPLPTIRPTPVPIPTPHLTWLEYLAEQSHGSPVLCLPMARGYGEVALESEARWMMFSTWHGQPLLNGYSGFFPSSWFEHTNRFARATLDEDDLRYLVQLGVFHIVLDRSRPDCPRLPASPNPGGDAFQPALVISTSAGIEVWRIQ